MPSADQWISGHLFLSFVAILMRQHPLAFEFQESFLFVLSDAISMINNKKCVLNRKGENLIVPLGSLFNALRLFEGTYTTNPNYKGPVYLKLTPCYKPIWIGFLQRFAT